MPPPPPLPPGLPPAPDPDAAPEPPPDPEAAGVSWGFCGVPPVSSAAFFPPFVGVFEPFLFGHLTGPLAA